MTTKDLALNFVSQFNKPFDLGTISSLIDRSPRSVKPVLAELLTAKQIRLVDPEQGIYVRDNRYNASVCYHQKGNWQFDPQAAIALLDQIESGSYNSVRAIAQTIGRSRQWVFVYMEALASIGCIAYENKAYKVTDRTSVKDIGKRIIPGILGSLKPGLSVEEKQRREAEKETKRQIRAKRQADREKIRKLEEEENARNQALIQAWQKYWKSSNRADLDLYYQLKNQQHSK